jgi:uncharacterized iron-regulated protein
MANIVVIEQNILDDLIKDVRDIKINILYKNSYEKTTIKEYYTIAEASFMTGLAEVTIRKKIDNLVKENDGSTQGIVKKCGRAIRIPYDILHNRILN